MVVSYDVDGENYNVRLNSLSPKLEFESIIEIAYHKENPTLIQVRENLIYKESSKMITVGSLGTVIFAFFLYKERKSNKL